MKKLSVILLAAAVMMLGMSVVSAAEKSNMFIKNETVKKVKAELLKKHGDKEKFRIERGVDQAASLWIKEDGSQKAFAGFCAQAFLPQGEKLDLVFERLERNNEIIAGYMVKISQELRKPMDLDWGEPLVIDRIFQAWSPYAHISDDFFKNKLAFMNRLNFPYYTLAEKIKRGPKWSRKEWAFARMGDGFTSRVPAEINLKSAEITSAAENYIAEYNIFAGRLVDENMKTYFPEKLKLISHWAIRDEISARHNDPEGLKKQEILYAVMKQIIKQEIPKQVINSDKYYWNPVTNKLYDENKKEIEFKPEPDTRYEQLHNTYKAMKLRDPYNPELNTHIKRMFDAAREIPEKEIEQLFIDLASSKEIRKIAKLMEKKLGRELRPFDIWYLGFRPGGDVPEEKLNKIVQKKYPNLEAFEKDISNILIKLGFTKEMAHFIAPKIKVEGARGAGHASGAAIRAEHSLLRTRVPKGGMDYKGFNTAMHELGHCVEQTLTLHKADYYSMHGIPNTAFTEAFAFLFQGKDLEILDVKTDQSQSRYLKSIKAAWDAYEIIGPSLVDMKVWNWMYAHPEATPAELKAATVKIAKNIWNKYYADVFGSKDEVLLGVYSHMICYRLYLPDYPMGYIIVAQVGEYIDGKNLGTEMERMCKIGVKLPHHWMKEAVGSRVSVKPLLNNVNEALKHITK
jgi:hypothetical protein